MVTTPVADAVSAEAIVATAPFGRLRSTVSMATFSANSSVDRCADFRYGAPVMVAHASDSTTQSDAEPLILAAVAEQLGVTLTPRRLKLPAGATADVDGVAADESVLVEVFARQGALKGGQRGKIARDALKLITLGRHRSGARLILALADESAAKPLRAKSWLAEALTTFEIEVLVVNLDPDVRAGIHAAQVRQVMVNTAPTSDESAS